MIVQFAHTFLHYISELWWTLAIGFFLSGVFYEFIPTTFVEKYLGKKGMRPIFLAAIIGVILPVCCIGSLPIALTLRKKGASLGSVMAFLVATPATSISALIVCWKLLGGSFTLAIFLAVIVMALIMGFVCNGIHVVSKKEDSPREKEKKKSCCSSGIKEESGKLSFKKRFISVLHYAFIQLPKSIGKEIFIGISLASFITVCEPLQLFIQHYLTGLLGYIFVLLGGVITYVCSTASVPMADAFLQSGMSYGQALCYLLVGPITSYGTILVIKKDFGGNVVVMYLGIICIFSLLSGIIFDMVMVP